MGRLPVRYVVIFIAAPYLLLMSQYSHRIDARRAPGGNVGRAEHDGRQQRGGGR
jgi:hypothetical protein